MAIVGATTAALGSSGAMSSAMSWLGGSTAGFSNSGLLAMGGSLLGGLTSFLDGGTEAEALAEAQREQWKQQMINTREQYRQLADMERVANKDHHEQIMQNQISLLQQQGQVELLAGASGTGGASISSMLGDLAGQAGRNQAQLIDNYERTQQGFINQAKAIQTGGQMTMQQFNKPSAFSSLVSGLGSAATSYLQFADIGKNLSKSYFESRPARSTTGMLKGGKLK